MPALLSMRNKTSTPAGLRLSKSESDALRRLDLHKIPRHIAVIMDGNGRWAKDRHMPRVFGHRAGMESVREIVRASAELHVEVLTLYAFSSENWARPPAEVQALMALLKEYLSRELPELNANRVRLRTIGRTDGLPDGAQHSLVKAIDATSHNAGLILNLALNYGGRQEIVDACNRAIRSGVKTFDDDTISRFLYTADCPDPDLLIRTSGERRLSNFLLWQLAYTEIYVTSVPWPAFRRPQFYEALADYQRRERRFGGL